MGTLFEELQKNAEIAKQENEEIEIERSKLQQQRDELERKINEIKKDETEH